MKLTGRWGAHTSTWSVLMCSVVILSYFSLSFGILSGSSASPTSPFLSLFWLFIINLLCSFLSTPPLGGCVITACGDWVVGVVTTPHPWTPPTQLARGRVESLGCLLRVRPIILPCIYAKSFSPSSHW